MTDKNAKRQKPADGSPVNNEREPEQEPNTDPRSGQHQPDILDERSSRRKRNNQPRSEKRIDPEENPGKDQGEFGDGDPVDERSPRIEGGL